MNGREIVLGPVAGRDAAALLVDGRLEDLIVDSDGLIPFAPGAILRGRMGRFVKGQGGVFVELPDGATGYLRRRAGLSEGKPILVQVSGVAEAGKAVALTTRVLFRGRYAIVTPGAKGVNVSRRIRDPQRRDMLEALGTEVMARLPIAGAIMRSVAASADDALIREEITALADLAGQVLADGADTNELLVDAPSPAEAAWQEWGGAEVDSVIEGQDAFADSGALDAIEALLSPRIVLNADGHAMIETTSALTAVDVNTGRDTSPAAALKANIALARDLPRQLRLRGIGGQIVIDFAPMPKRDRGTLDQVLRAAFKHESSETSLVGWTTMGLYEISRKRDRVPLADWWGQG